MNETNQIKTVRRDWLKRQVEQGKIQSKCVFEIEHDGNGSNDRFGGQWLDARIRKPRYEEITNCYGNKQTVCADTDFIEGASNFTQFDFSTKSGGAYTAGVDDEGRKLYTLHIHSNAVYALREKRTSVCPVCEDSHCETKSDQCGK